MLDQHQTRYAAFYREADAGYYCRACTVKAAGPLMVQRIEAGRVTGIHGWERVIQYELDERAEDLSDQCEESDHPKDNAGQCVLCDELLCTGCGAVLAGCHAPLTTTT